MLRVLCAGFVGLAYAQYNLESTKSAGDEVEYVAKSKDGKDTRELRMRIRTKTDDSTLEMEIESRSTTDKTKVSARTRFNVRSAYVYEDADGNGLLGATETATATMYDLSHQFGPISCTATTPYNCSVCNTGSLAPKALCFDFLVADRVMTFGNHTVSPTTVKINMYWDSLGNTSFVGKRIALIGRFRSQAKFKAKANETVNAQEEGQATEDGSMVKWETRVYTPAGASSDVKVGVYIPGNGLAEGTELDGSDGSSMSYRQLQFNFAAADPFKWDPDIMMPTSGAITLVPCALISLLALFL